MQQKTEALSNGSMIGGGIVSILSSSWIWLGNNHVQIAALCGLIGAVIGVLGFLHNIYHKRQVRKYLAAHENIEDIPAYIIDGLERRKPLKDYYQKKS